jgi:GR25 family glycosyltransferase involved in LPS biosynthesis
MDKKLKVCENVYIDKIYVINLEFQKELREKITVHLKNLGIFEFVQFIDAVYEPKKPSWGCALSHHKALNDMKENNYDAVMILEDDCVFKEFPFSIIDPVPEDWQMLYPGYLCHDEVSFKHNNSFLRLIDARSTHCYIIKKDILQYVLLTTLSKQNPIDIQYVSPVQKAYPCYGFYPIRAYQSQHKSTVGCDNTFWDPIMDKKAEKCFNNPETPEKIKISNRWKGHYKDVFRIHGIPITK